jgi:predicted nucleic-acid-binding protein
LRAVDTNVLVRLIVDDDPAQADAAQRAMASESVFVPKTVVLELEWVLRSVYELSSTTIATVIEGLLSAADVLVEDATAISRAVAWFKDGLDLADALHLASSSHVGAFITFDAAMRRRAAAMGVRPPVAAP